MKWENGGKWKVKEKAKAGRKAVLSAYKWKSSALLIIYVNLRLGYIEPTHGETSENA